MRNRQTTQNKMSVKKMGSSSTNRSMRPIRMSVMLNELQVNGDAVRRFCGNHNVYRACNNRWYDYSTSQILVMLEEVLVLQWPKC